MMTMMKELKRVRATVFVPVTIEFAPFVYPEENASEVIYDAILEEANEEIKRQVENGEDIGGASSSSHLACHF